MSFKNLTDPITNSGIKNTNFFEGRLLSGKDLREQQDANKLHRQQLGRTLGHGVVEGLEVSVENAGSGQNSPVVRVAKGLAINLEGDTVELAQDYVDIQLSREVQLPSIADTTFKRCNNMPTETLPSNAGLYILVMSPASAYHQYAPKSGLQTPGVAHNCGRAYIVEGVQFRLVKFDPTQMSDISEDTKTLLNEVYLDTGDPVAPSDYQKLSKLQNIIAHVCYGTEASKLSQTSVFKAVANPVGGLDALLGNNLGLSKCDIPLAMVYWTLKGIGFVDNWSVKRKVHSHQGVHQSYSLNERRSYAIYEAMLFQFQDQIDNLLLKKLDVSELTTLSAANYFHYLPPAGVLPQYNFDHSGFAHDRFFDQQPHKAPLYISEKQVRELIAASANLAPIRTAAKELVWIYKTWERDFQESQGTYSRPHIIFNSGYAPKFATPRFDLSQWDYSNYA